MWFRTCHLLQDKRLFVAQSLLFVLFLELPDLAALALVRGKDRAVLWDRSDGDGCILVAAAHHGLSWLDRSHHALQFWREVQSLDGSALQPQVHHGPRVIQDDLALFQELARVLRKRELGDAQFPEAPRTRFQVFAPGRVLEHVAGLFYHV